MVAALRLQLSINPAQRDHPKESRYLRVLVNFLVLLILSGLD